MVRADVLERPKRKVDHTVKQQQARAVVLAHRVEVDDAAVIVVGITRYLRADHHGTARLLGSASNVKCVQEMEVRTSHIVGTGAGRRASRVLGAGLDVENAVRRINDRR